MKKLIQASGKRKSARARAVLSSGKGFVSIDGVPIDNFGTKYVRMKIKEPLILAGSDAETVNIKVSVQGGGVSGQAEAIRLVIARALSEHNAALKEKFLEYDRNLLVADVRSKETRKPNTHGKARSKRQKSYR